VISNLYLVLPASRVCQAIVKVGSACQNSLESAQYRLPYNLPWPIWLNLSSRTYDLSRLLVSLVLVSIQLVLYSPKFSLFVHFHLPIWYMFHSIWLKFPSQTLKRNMEKDYDGLDMWNVRKKNWPQGWTPSWRGYPFDGV